MAYQLCLGLISELMLNVSVLSWHGGSRISSWSRQKRSRVIPVGYYCQCAAMHVVQLQYVQYLRTVSFAVAVTSEQLGAGNG